MSTPLMRFAPWIIAFTGIIADQITKQIVVHSMKLHESVSVLGDIVRFTYIHNSGMAFGVKLAGGRVLGIISIIATIIFIVVLIRSKSEPPVIQLTLGAIIGGAIGNAIDRIRLGYVIDFIDVDLPDWLMERWPVFNIADSMVSVSVVIMISFIFYSSFIEKKLETGEKAKDVDGMDNFVAELESNQIDDNEPLKIEKLDQGNHN